MGSENAKAVAEEVIEKLENGEKVVLGEIIENHGYSESTQNNPKWVTETKSYQEVMSPVVDRMKSIRDKIVAEMEVKDISKERLSDLSTILKNTNHDIQLLSGEPTDITKNKEYEDLAEGLEKLRLEILSKDDK